jgi:hypothetical protein
VSRESVIARARQATVDLGDFPSKVTIRRKTGNMTTDSRGLQVPEWATVYTDIPCRIAGMARSQSPSRTLDIGGVQVQVSVRTAHLPHDTTDLRDGDLLDVTGESAGVYQIVESDPADQQTARRVPVIAAQRPEEWS